MAERAGLENRRWGNLSASSNLAPSAKFRYRLSCEAICDQSRSRIPLSPIFRQATPPPHDSCFLIFITEHKGFWSKITGCNPLRVTGNWFGQICD